MTRPTKYVKESIVRRILDDVPSIDYSEEAQKVIQAHAISLMPKEVRAIYDNKETRHLLHKEWVTTPGCLHGVTVYAEDGYKQRMNGSHLQDVVEIANKEQLQREQRYNLRNQLTALVDSCTTVKKLHKLLPEFKKYLPEIDGPLPIENLPSASNLVTALITAGWTGATPALTEK